MSESNLVSVVMPAYNARETLAESIESVLSQTYKNLELFVVDDGSSDKSADIADFLGAKDSRVRVIRSLRRGVVEARNTASRAARGEFIAFCDSDDLWHREKLDRQLSFMKSCGSAISATGLLRIDESGRPISGAISLPKRIGYEDLLATNYICCASVLYDVNALGKIYMYDYRERGRLPLYMRVGAPKPLHEDYIAWARLLSTEIWIDTLDEPLTYYRVRAKSHSSNKISSAVARWYINGNVLGVPLHRNVGYFTRYAIGACLRRLRWRTGLFKRRAVQR